VEEVLPDQIEVRLAQLTGKLVPVDIELEGEPPVGYSLALPEVEDEEVFVTGPQDEVDQVTRAVGAIEITGKTGHVQEAVRLTPRDSRGTLIQGVELDPGITEVSVEIEEEKFTRIVTVSPVITGTPAAGYNVTGVSVSPESVTIRGDEALVQGTISIETKPVSIDDASEDVVKSVSLDLPPGAELTGGTPVVTVTVNVKPVQGTIQIAVPVTPSGLDSALAIKGTLPSVVITLDGDLPTLQTLTASDVLALIDLSGKNAGTHLVPVSARTPDGVTAKSVDPARVEVTLEKR
jgi:YbbR domain-containing protein